MPRLQSIEAFRRTAIYARDDFIDFCFAFFFLILFLRLTGSHSLSWLCLSSVCHSSCGNAATANTQPRARRHNTMNYRFQFCRQSACLSLVKAARTFANTDGKLSLSFPFFFFFFNLISAISHSWGVFNSLILFSSFSLRNWCKIIFQCSNICGRSIILCTLKYFLENAVYLVLSWFWLLRGPRKCKLSCLWAMRECAFACARARPSGVLTVVIVS